MSQAVAAVPQAAAKTTEPFESGAPHNFEAEQALLGALLINNEAYYQISSFLEAKHFYDPAHGRIYGDIARLVGDGQPVSPITLRPFLETDPALAQKGGADYLVKLAGGAGALISVEAHARSIQSLATRRDLMRAGQEIYSRALEVRIDDPPRRQLEAAEQTLYGIAEKGRYQEGFLDFNQSLAEAIERAEQAKSAGGKISGLATGLTALDEKLGGFQPSDLVIIAGRPSMGKTALATNIAFHAAQNWRGQKEEDGSVKTQSGAIVGFFSLEMSAEHLATRILAERAKIPGHLIRQGRINDEEFQNLAHACREIENAPLYIDHTGAIPISTLAARARRLKRQRGLDLLVVDYLQLATTDGRRRNDGRVQEVSEITQGLKALAKELQIPVVALSQLSRQAEMREDKRPQLADLRESGAIEQDADVVLFVFREEYYLGRQEPKDDPDAHAKWQEKMSRVAGKAEIDVGKHRHGPTGKVDLHFDARFTRFGNLAYETDFPQDSPPY